MSTILQDLTYDKVNRILAEIVQERIADELEKSEPGHCLRISVLPEAVMQDLCLQFNNNGNNADVVLLLGPNQQPEANWQVSATRLIELRNAETRPLLAFIPPGLKTAAEDSFDVSTFSEVNLGDVPAQLRQELRSKLPQELRELVDEVVWYMEKSVKKVDDDDIARYFLTILENGATKEAAGGAIYQFRLVPHFALLDERNRIRQQLDRNVTAVDLLTDGVQPLLGRIHSLKLKANTIQSPLYEFLRERLLEGPATWTKLVATDVNYRHLAFDHWQFADEGGGDEKILLYMDELGLTVKYPDQPVGPDNPPYLDVQRTRTVKVKWQANRKPVTVPQLAYYRLELVNADGAIVWESNNIPKGTGRSTSKTKTLKVAEFRGLVEDEEDEGIYFFRVRGYSESGEILNEEDPENDIKVLRDPSNPEGKLINESEDVWFWSDPEAPPPAEPQRNITVTSFLDAKLLAQFAAIDRGDDPFSENLKPRSDKTGWATKSSSKRADAVFNIVYDAQARYTLPINSLLRRIEQETLANPEFLGRWRLDFRDEQTTHYSVDLTLRQFRNPERVPSSFMAIRKTLFSAIRGEDGQDFLTATIDLVKYADLILAYAQAYDDWLEEIAEQFDKEAIYEVNGRRRTEAIFLDLDITELLLPRHGHVYLIAPTHPLRLLWHLQQAQLAQNWLETATSQGDAGKRLTESIRSFMRRGLAPVNLPTTIRTAYGKNLETVPRFYVEQGPITPFWTLYMRENVRDKQTLRARVQRALGISYRTAHHIGEVDKQLLSQKILRYLVQHPYVHVLKINVFNPGNASLIVDAILEIEKSRKDSPSLRYELRLFTQSDRIDDIGEAVEDLVNPERQVSAEADAFTIPSRNHLFPKLRFSRNKLEEFLAQPEEHEAHISILRDLFPIDVEPELIGNGRSSFLHGLVQEQVSQFSGDESHFAWQRQLLPTSCQELSNDTYGVSTLISNIIHRVETLQASIAVGRKSDNTVPTLRLNLPPTEKNFLYQVHAISDWVFIIDRYLGLEYFDSQATPDRPMYLLDFTPEFAGTDTDRLLLTTRAVEEVVRLVQPALDKYNLLDDEGVVEFYFLQLLRSLSGRLALKLLSSPNHLNEALGLAMSRLFLEQYGLLDNAIVLPLDAHSTLFNEAGAEPVLEEVVTLQRGDLLLVTCDPSSRALHFYIMEVKWRSDLGDFSLYMSLRQDIEGQLKNSEKVLRQHFDPQLHSVDRLDRQVKTKELISLLNFYLDRSRRYELISETAEPGIRNFIQGLDRGYHLSCAGVGLIFDFAHEGLTSEEEHAGLVFHRVGHDYIRKLLDNGLRRQSLLEKQATEKPVTVEESEQKEAAMQRIKEDTTMRRDPSYQRVRTYFPTRSLEEVNEAVAEDKSQSAAESVNETPELHQAKTEYSIEHEDTPVQSKVLPSEAEKQLNEKPHDESEKESLVTPVTADDHESDHSIPTPPISVEPQVSSGEELTSFACDVLLGLESMNLQQFGILGKSGGKFVGLDLNGTNTISLFGVQGGGKSYTLGSIVEMASQPFSGINQLPAPLATVIFHYHESQDYAPEFVSMVGPNSDEAQMKALEQEYGAQPGALQDVLLLTSPDKIAARRAEFPSVQVEPIYFSSNELSIKDWRFLMGAMGNQMYMKQINLIMRQLRNKLTLQTLQHEIENSALTDSQKSIARVRLTFAAEFINDTVRLADKLKPGRLIIVDLRDEFIEKDEALGLFVVMLNIFANAGQGKNFNKLIVFDEAHKYMDNRDLTIHIVDVIRQMRHQGVSLLIASQDPPSLPNEIIELSSLVIMHRFNSPQWLKHVQRSITALADLAPAQMAALRPGDAYVWATKATERVFTQKAVKMRLRPRITQHGGGTKTAVNT